MKNTEYEDVFDFGQEVVSMDNKFSISAFPSFKKSFTIGEKIRGMNNVNPLATVKFFNQSSNDVLAKYYPDAGSPVEGTFTYILDVGSDLESVIKTTVKDFYYYGVEDVNNFAFKVIIFSSKDATKLKESFDVSEPQGREILIFVEDNTEDKASGTYGAIKISNDVLSFLNKSRRLEYDLYNNDEVYKEIKKVIPELDDDQIKTLLQKGHIEDIRVDIAKTYFKLASFFSSGISSIYPGLGILTNDALRKATSVLLEKVILLIEETRFGENRWQPKPPKLENGEVDKNYQYNPLISSGKDSNGIVNFSEITGLLKTMLTDQNNLVRLVLNIKKDFRKNSQPKGFLELLYNLYLSAYDIMYDVITGLDDISNLDVLKYGVQTYNALLCGVWNGLVDSVSGLFAMVKMIYDGITMGKDFVQNIDKYLPTLLEQFDEAVQAIKKISFTETAKYIYEKLKEINLTFDPVACSYFIGYAFGFIISLVIEIIVGILVSGGTLSVAAIVNALAETILGIFRLGFSAVKGVVKAVRTFSKFVVKSIQDLLKGFQELLNFLKKGWPEIRKIVDETFEGISLLRRGKYLGQALDEFDFIKIEKFLKRLRVELQVGEAKGVFEVKGFFYSSGKPLLLEAHNAAMFVTDGIKMKLVLRENATIYEVLHELMHMRDCQKIGMKNFSQKPLVDREKYVYDKMVEFAKYLNKKELKHAEDYINWHYGKVGKTDNFGNPIKEILPFNLDDIPKKRQEINIDKILNLK